MIKVDHEITINRPVEEVFRYVVDARNDPEWCPPVLAVEQITGSEPRIDATYRFTAKPGPKQLEGRFAITDLHENEWAEYEGENEALRFRYAYGFTSVGSATTVRMTSELHAKGFWKLLVPIIRAGTKKITVEEFENLKEILEAGGQRER